MRFKLGDLICILTDYEASLPLCYTENEKFLMRLDAPFNNPQTDLFCKLPQKTPVMGYVCGQTSKSACFAGAEFSSYMTYFVFAMIFCKNEPVLVRINEYEQILYKIVDSIYLQDKNGVVVSLLDDIRTQP